MNYKQKLDLASQQYHNAGGPQVVKTTQSAPIVVAQPLPSTRQKLQIKVVNNSTAAESNVRLFGSLKIDEIDTYNTNVTVTPANASHKELLRKLQSSPMRVSGVKIKAENSEDQLAQEITIIEEGTRGNKAEETVLPLDYIRASDNRVKFVEIPADNFSFVLNEERRLEFKIDAGESVTFIFNVSEEIATDAALRGMPTVKAGENTKFRSI